MTNRCQMLLLCLAALWSFSAPSRAQDSFNFPTIGELLRADPAFDALIDPAARLEVVASGFAWCEGLVWVDEADGPGYLLFSDVPKNSILKWVEGKGVSLYMQPSGYTGVTEYGAEPGSNGLLLDHQGQLICCEHGDRRISVLTKQGGKRTLADNFQGKRFHGPNDAVLKSNGDLYFTDPPYALPKQWNDPRRELDFSGVFRLTQAGTLTLATKELSRPNGIAFSPDEKTLYVGETDSKAFGWKAFPVNDDGTLGPGRVFHDTSSVAGQRLRGAPDGIAVDKHGNVFATGPGGIWVFTLQGKFLGRINTVEGSAGCTFGGKNRDVLYITADMNLCRIQTKTSQRLTSP